jgi:hypothetical protein
MRRLICRVLGHRWAWPEILVFVARDGRVVRFAAHTSCLRCGCMDQSLSPDTHVHVRAAFEVPVVGLSPGFVESLKRQMGWN